MRYLIDAEYRQRRSDTKPPVSAGFATALQQELSERNLQWASEHRFLHETTMGNVPAVLYREDERGRHGNFLEASYRAMCGNLAWKSRLQKVHSSAKRRLLSHDPGRSELDSSNSSDALLMNIFCHPETLRTRGVRELLNVAADAEPVFGYKPRIALSSKHVDCTEVDLKLGDLLIEAKLTEYDFQRAPRRLIDRYARFGQVFDHSHQDLSGEMVESYQLLRGVLAADSHPGHRFCVLCDARRPDLIERWHRVMFMVVPYDLRCRLLLLTWQELASVVPLEGSRFLEAKYGIRAV